MAKTKEPLKTFERTIGVASWVKKVEEAKVSNNWTSTLYHELWRWLSEHIGKITKKIFEDEDLPDKFQLILTMPRVLHDIRDTIYLDDDRHIKRVKSEFRDSDQLRFIGLSKNRWGTYSGEKQTKTVSVKFESEGDILRLTATYKPKPRSTSIERNNVSIFKPSFPMIVFASTEIISKGHISTPGTDVKIEASIQVMNQSHSFSTRKYIIDLENRTLIERKTGDVKTFGNQEEFFEHLISDLT